MGEKINCNTCQDTGVALIEIDGEESTVWCGCITGKQMRSLYDGDIKEYLLKKAQKSGAVLDDPSGNLPQMVVPASQKPPPIPREVKEYDSHPFVRGVEKMEDKVSDIASFFDLFKINDDDDE